MLATAVSLSCSVHKTDGASQGEGLVLPRLWGPAQGLYLAIHVTLHQGLHPLAPVNLLYHQLPGHHGEALS